MIQTMPLVIGVLEILVEHGSMSVEPRCHGAFPISGCQFLRTPRVEAWANPRSRSTEVIKKIHAYREKNQGQLI